MVKLCQTAEGSQIDLNGLSVCLTTTSVNALPVRPVVLGAGFERP